MWIWDDNKCIQFSTEGKHLHFLKAFLDIRTDWLQFIREFVGNIVFWNWEIDSWEFGF